MGLNKKHIWILTRTLSLVFVIIFIKVLFHHLGIELISINNLFNSILAGNVFLMGFLLSGVLSDYKESEKIPGEMASIISSLYDDFLIIKSKNKDPKVLQAIHEIAKVAVNLKLWFYKELKTKDILLFISKFNSVTSELEQLVAVNHIIRFKNDIAQLKKLIIRTDTIRDTSFLSSGYLIACLTTLLLSIGLILTKIKPFYESLFFVGVISFLMIFLLLLIRDLDNPFEYGHNRKYLTENVSLYSLERVIAETEESEKQLQTKGKA